MAALDVDLNISAVGKTRNSKFSANGTDVFFRGAIVFIDATGGVQSVPVDGDRVLGICPYYQTSVAGDEVEVIVQGLIWMPLGLAIAVGDEGDILMVDNDVTLSDNVADHPSTIATQTATQLTVGDMAIGRILRVKSDKMLLGITPAITGSIITAAAVLQFD